MQIGFTIRKRDPEGGIALGTAFEDIPEKTGLPSFELERRFPGSRRLINFSW